jgi:hypothetical protein
MAGQSVQLNTVVTATLASKAVNYVVDETASDVVPEITSGGLVTIPADAVSGNDIVIKVVSVFDPTKYDTVYITVA